MDEPQNAFFNWLDLPTHDLCQSQATQDGELLLVLDHVSSFCSEHSPMKFSPCLCNTCKSTIYRQRQTLTWDTDKSLCHQSQGY